MTLLSTKQISNKSPCKQQVSPLPSKICTCTLGTEGGGASMKQSKLQPCASGTYCRDSWSAMGQLSTLSFFLSGEERMVLKITSIKEDFATPGLGSHPLIGGKSSFLWSFHLSSLCSSCQ